MESSKEYSMVSLSMNFAEANLNLACGGGITKCKPGGSYICTGTSAKTCPPGTCAGASIEPTQRGLEGVADNPMDIQLMVKQSDMEKLKAELHKTLKKFTKE